MSCEYDEKSSEGDSLLWLLSESGVGRFGMEPWCGTKREERDETECEEGAGEDGPLKGGGETGAV